jgi:cytochrome P450
MQDIKPQKGKRLPTATLLDTLAIATDIAIPTIAKGVIIRRPRVVAMAEKLGLDTRAVRRMQRLNDKYGPGPLMLKLGDKPRALVLSPEHVYRVLEGTPEPFAPAASEKRAALAHFEPKVALISHGPQRADRRLFNEEVLETAKPVHGLAEPFLRICDEEMAALIREAAAAGELSWSLFFERWYRTVRRIVLGSGAADDHELTDMLAKLRQRANWAFFRSQDEQLRDRFHARLRMHLQRAEPGTLAGVIASTSKTPATEPSQQVAQWLFAFDPAGMATFRTLAVLSTHGGAWQRAEAEIAGKSVDERARLPFLRACALESLRLWPTTPLVLRETTAETEWENGAMPAATTVAIVASYFHRDNRYVEWADRFDPDLWLEGNPAKTWPLIPFSMGPAVCPAKNLVPMLASAALAGIIGRARLRLKNPARLDPAKPLPGTLDNYTLRFGLESLPS